MTRIPVEIAVFPLFTEIYNQVSKETQERLRNRRR